jgi:capsular polysaccharide transport system permease protein
MISLQALTPGRLKLAVIALPLALATVYFTVFATDRYVSESVVALQQSGNEAAAQVPGAALLLAGITPPSREDTLYLRQYIGSLGLLLQLEPQLGLRKHYEGGGIDFIARLWRGASQEDFLDYWRNRVEVTMDELSSTLTVRVQGFDAKYAREVNRAVLAASEQFVNELSHKLAREKLDFAEGELKRAAQKLQVARGELLTYQARNKLLDPMVQAQASGAIVAELQGSITRAEAELRALRSFLNDDAAQVRTLRTQIDAMRAQLEAERGRAIGQGNGQNSGRRGEKLNELAAEFQGLQMQAEFALDAYKLSLAAVENARIDTTRKLKSLSVIEPPTLPETAEYPRRLYNLATVLVAAFLLYSVARLVIATIREHQD